MKNKDFEFFNQQLILPLCVKTSEELNIDIIKKYLQTKSSLDVNTKNYFIDNCLKVYADENISSKEKEKSIKKHAILRFLDNNDQDEDNDKDKAPLGKYIIEENDMKITIDLKNIEIRYIRLNLNNDDNNKNEYLVFITFLTRCTEGQLENILKSSDKLNDKKEFVLKTNDKSRFIYTKSYNADVETKIEIKDHSILDKQLTIKSKETSKSRNKSEGVEKILKKLFKNSDQEDNLEITYLHGDKMFLSSSVFNSGFDCKNLDYINLENNLSEDHQLRNLDDLLALMLADSEKPCVQNKKMKIDIFNNGSYKRWTDYNTIQLMSEYTMIFVTDINDGNEWLTPHQEKIYYEMYMICLQHRMFLKIFHNNLMSDNTQENIDSKQQTKDVCNDYFNIVNNYIFREISIEVQGIELYEQLSFIQKINELEQAVTKDIEIEFQQQLVDKTDEVNETIDDLTRESNRIAICSLAIAILAVLTTLRSSYATATGYQFSETFREGVIDVFLFGVIILVIVYLTVVVSCKVYGNKKRREK